MNIRVLLIVVVIAVAAFLRLYQLPLFPPGLYPDEAMNGNNALEALGTRDWKVFYPENNGREGLFINIQSFFLWLFGTHEPWVLRFPSGLFGVLTVLGLYLLVREAFEVFSSSDPKSSNRAEIVALLASFLLATSFWHVNFSRIGFRAIMAPAFLTWSLFLLFKAFSNTTSKGTYAKAGWCALLGGLVYGLGWHSYIAYRITPLIVLVPFIIFWRRSAQERMLRRTLATTALFAIGTVATIAPLAWYFFSHPQDFVGRTGQISIFNSPTPLKDLGVNILKTAGMFNVRGDYNWRHNIAGRPELFWPVGIFFVVGLVTSVIAIFRKKTTEEKSERFILELSLIWLLAAALPVVISNEGIPHALRAILMVPPVFVLAAYGAFRLYELIAAAITAHRQKTNKTFMLTTLRIFVVLILSLLAFEAYASYFYRWARNEHTPAAFAAQDTKIAALLNAAPQELNKYVIVLAGGVDVRGIPMPAQTVMFLTDTFLPERRKEKNIHYLLPGEMQEEAIREGLIVTIR